MGRRFARSSINSVKPLSPALAYQLLADMVLLVHFGVVLFVVGMLAMVLLGNWRGWRWVNAWWLRILHLLTISFVVVQAWLGQLCPLTTLESWLRQQVGGEAYSKSFIEHWVHKIIYIEASFFMFSAAYTAFGLLVVWAWWRFPPVRQR